LSTINLENLTVITIQEEIRLSSMLKANY